MYRYWNLGFSSSIASKCIIYGDIVQGLRGLVASRSTRNAARLGSTTCHACAHDMERLCLKMSYLNMCNIGRWHGPNGVVSNKIGKRRLLSGAPKSHRHHNPFDFYPDDRPPNMEDAVFGTDEFMHQQYVFYIGILFKCVWLLDDALLF